MLPCGSPAPLPEIYNQNNGQPVVVYAYGDGSNDIIPSLPPTLPAPCGCEAAPAPIPIIPELPPVLPPVLPPALPIAPVLPVPEPTDLDTAQLLADQSINEQQPLETIAAPDTPCKVETSTEVIHTPGETFVHQPGEILINQPPTRLIINHAPYIVRPSAIIVNQGSKKITNAFTRKFLPSPVQYRPVIVRIVRPVEKKVLIDKPQKPGSQNYVQNPVIPDQCASASYADAAAAPLPLPIDASPDFALPADYSLPADFSLPADLSGAADYSALFAQANAVSVYKFDGNCIELL